MKRLIAILIAVLTACQFNIIAYADNKAKISASDITISGQEQNVDVVISDNPGIMGFMISVSYPYEYIDVASVSRGAVTSKGNFYDNLGMNNGVFDVVWNNTSEIKANGVLFSFSVKAISDIPIELEIKISYKKGETFNEKYEEVELDCNNITIKQNVQDISSTTVFTDTDAKNDKDEAITSDKAEKELDEVIKEAVKAVLEQNGYSSIDEVQNEKEFISQVNELVSDSGYDVKIKDINELKEAFGTVDVQVNEADEKEAQRVSEKSNTGKIVISAGLLAVALAVLAFILKKHKKI